MDQLNFVDVADLEISWIEVGIFAQLKGAAKAGVSFYTDVLVIFEVGSCVPDHNNHFSFRRYAQHHCVSPLFSDVRFHNAARSDGSRQSLFLRLFLFRLFWRVVGFSLPLIGFGEEVFQVLLNVMICALRFFQNGLQLADF